MRAEDRAFGDTSAAFGRGVVRARWIVMPLWIVAALAAFRYLPALHSVSGGDFGGLVPKHSPAVATEEQVLRQFAFPVLSRFEMVQYDRDGLSLATQLRVISRAIELDEHQVPGFEGILGALPVTNAGGLFPGSRQAGTTAVTYLFFNPKLSSGTQVRLAQRYVRRYLGPSDHYVGITGAIPAREAQDRAFKHALPLIELATIALVSLVIGMTFRSVVAPIIALAAAGIAYFTAVHILGWATEHLRIATPREVEPLLIVLLVGVTTDYAIFILSACRRYRRDGLPPRAATASAAAEVAPIVAVAGTAVAGGTAILAIAHLPLFREVGPGMAVTVLVAVAVATTFLPATIGAFGSVVFWPGHSAAPVGAGHRHTSWRRRLDRHLVGRPVAAVVVVVGIGALAVLANPDRHLRLGTNLVAGSGSASGVAHTANVLARGMAPGMVAPFEIVVDGAGIVHRTQELATLQHELAGQRGVAGVLGPQQQPLPIDAGAIKSPSGDAVRYVVLLSDSAYGGPAIQHVQALEDSAPRLLATAGLTKATAHFAGDTAISAELVRLTWEDILEVGLATLGVDFLVLLLFLRSVVAAALLAGASGLAVLAAVGITTWAVQDLIGFNSLTFYVPFGAGVLLLAFGADYNVYVVGRIWQRARTDEFGQAIVVAGSAAARAITVAGLALAASFSLLAIVPIAAFREFAALMVVGILIDTFFVRSVLVPAGLALLGRTAQWPGHRLSAPRQRRALDTVAGDAAVGDISPEPVSPAPQRGIGGPEESE